MESKVRVSYYKCLYVNASRVVTYESAGLLGTWLWVLLNTPKSFNWRWDDTVNNVTLQHIFLLLSHQTCQKPRINAQCRVFLCSNRAIFERVRFQNFVRVGLWDIGFEGVRKVPERVNTRVLCVKVNPATGGL